MRLMQLSMMSMLALTLAACGAAQAPGDASGLRSVLGRSLAGVEGKTLTDQRRIAVRHARECAAKLWPGEC